MLVAVLFINTALQTRGVPESRKDSIPLSRMCKQQLSSIHAADENLDIAAVAEAAAFYKYFVVNYR